MVATHEPRRQERGRRRIELILDAAEEVIAEVGYEAATTNLIAARAQISPGSLYQYFANRAAIVEALNARFVAHLAAARHGLDVVDLVGRPIPVLVDRIVDPIVDFSVAHPSANALLASVDVVPELAASGRALHTAIAERIGALVAAIAPGRGAHDRALATTVSLQILAGVLPTIVTAPPRERRALVRELKRALGAYWSTLSPSGS